MVEFVPLLTLIKKYTYLYSQFLTLHIQPWDDSAIQTSEALK